MQYLGQGAHHGKVSDLAYHNSLMVQIWSMLATSDATLAAHALRRLPPVPSTTTWITYVRCHDDIGWAIDDGDAAAVGLNGYGHRRSCPTATPAIYPGLAGPRAGLPGQPGDRGPADQRDGRQPGRAGGRRAAPEDVDPVVGRLFLAHAVIMGWGGIPVIWMGDELAMLNDPDWAAEPGHEDDNRWAHRPRMDWAAGRATARPAHGAGAGLPGL